MFKKFLDYVLRLRLRSSKDQSTITEGHVFSQNNQSINYVSRRLPLCTTPLQIVSLLMWLDVIDFLPNEGNHCHHSANHHDLYKTRNLFLLNFLVWVLFFKFNTLQETSVFILISFSVPKIYCDTFQIWSNFCRTWVTYFFITFVFNSLWYHCTPFLLDVIYSWPSFH